MEASEDVLELKLPARSASVAEARRAAEQLAREAGAPRSKVALAVSEAVSNAIQHAYRGGGEGSIMLRGWTDAGRLVVEVIDRGVGMRPNPAGRGLGLGLSLIGLVADALEIVARPETTTVKMEFQAGDRPTS